MLAYVERLPDTARLRRDPDTGEEPWDIMHELTALNVEIASRSAVAAGALDKPIEVPRPSAIEAARTRAAATQGTHHPDAGAAAAAADNPFAAAMGRMASTRAEGR